MSAALAACAANAAITWPQAVTYSVIAVAIAGAAAVFFWALFR